VTTKSKVDYDDVFLREARRLQRKFRRIGVDIQGLVEQLENGDRPGERLQGVEPYIVYKVRLPSTDMGRGKRGAFASSTILKLKIGVFC
jgi:mRNA-degrading endonuclease RelE of RelBE toxin-antitoxin system